MKIALDGGNLMSEQIDRVCNEDDMNRGFVDQHLNDSVMPPQS